MKILSLRVEQFRKFDQPVMIGGFGDGLNLIAGPNETGKSTLLLALRAALFERHGAKTQAVKDFAPHNVTGARPTVTLAFELGGEHYRLEKSFLKRPEARLEAGAGRRFEGSDAENELKRLLGLNVSEKTSAGRDSPAHFGVLLTPQGKSFRQPDLADGTRHSLEAAIADEITEFGNQGEVDGLIAEFEGMLFEIVSKRGEPKNRYKDVTARLAKIESEIAEATVEQDTLSEQLEELAQAIGRRSALHAAETAENLSDQLAKLEASRAKAARRQTLENRRLAARQRLQAVEARRASKQARLKDRHRIAAEIEVAAGDAANANGLLVTLDNAVKEREQQLADLGGQQEDVGRHYRDLDSLSRQYERLGQIRTTLSALATDVRMELEAGALDRVTLNGEPVRETQELRQVTEGLSIEIAGIGLIGIEPKTEPMRETLAAKEEVEREIDNLLAALDLEDTEPEAIEVAWQAVVSERDALTASRTEIESALADERRQAAEAKAVLDASNDRKARLTQELAEIDPADGGEAEGHDSIDAEIAIAKAAFDDADNAFKAEIQSDGPDRSPVAVDRLDAEIAGLRRQIEERRRAIDDASKKVVALEAAIGVRSGLGLDEKIDQLDRQRHLLAQERDAFALEHRALALLQSTLNDAAEEARATFNRPLSARLVPYIQDLFPGAAPLVTPDFSIRAIGRNGVEEPFLQLSDGTREQIAILARLAFADMLRERGLPAIIVLDDALAFSDDRRFERMFAILKKVAERMQVIVLTCREDRFAGVQATRLQIRPAPGKAPSAA